MAGPGSLRVAIVGGSIGGLTAAVLLRDLGCMVEVFERSAAELQGRGAGIVVHEMSVRYLVENRIADIDALSLASHRHVHVDAGGATIHDDPIAYRYTSWNTLYRNLLRSLGSDRYHLGHAVTGFHDTGREVVVGTAAGETACDLLICADGVASTGRAMLQPQAQPQYAGYVGWRGTVPETVLGPSARSSLEDTLIYHWTGSSHILAYMIPGTSGEVRAGRRLVNFVWYRNVPELRLSELMTDIARVEHSLSLPPGSVREPHLQELRHAARSLPRVLAELVLATTEPFIQKIVDVEVDSMAFGRICLLGDAAFTARPHTAAGTAKAAADAWALAEALRTHGEVSVALAAWESRQLPVGRQLVARARDLGERSQVRGGWRPDDPYQRFGLWAPGDSRITAIA
ncbi:MAG TPA: FAD-dependent monooxygenase [Candidatus Dormibacteraeota bacterium]